MGRATPSLVLCGVMYLRSPVAEYSYMVLLLARYTVMRHPLLYLRARPKLTNLTDNGQQRRLTR